MGDLKKDSKFAFEQLFETFVRILVKQERMDETTQLNNEQTIRQAAHKIFKMKGFDNATVQEIADEAATTKSMVNYYFRSKENLFASIFHQEFVNFLSGVLGFISSDLPLYNKIEKIVELDIERLLEMPELPVFVINEINRNPEIVFKNIANIPIKKFLKQLNTQIAEEVSKGNIKPVKAEMLLINIQSLTIFPLLAKPMLMRVFDLSEKTFRQMIESRKKEVIQLIWQSIKK